MKSVLLASLTLLLFLGCHKKQAAADAGTNPEGSSTAASADQAQGQPVSNKPLPPPPPPVAANANNAVQAGVNGQVDPFLTTQLRIFMNQTGRLPQSFAELASRRLDSMPVPPQGTKWVIDSSDSQVKAVPTK
jgi:hypothetical protein